MSASPITRRASATAQLVQVVENRLVRLGALRGAAVGLAIAAVIALRHLVYVALSPTAPSTGRHLFVEGAIAVMGAVVSALVGAWWARRRVTQSPESVAQTIEAGVPASRNLLRTAIELDGVDAPRTSENVAVIVRARSDALASSINGESIVPSTVAQKRVGIAAGVWAVCVVLTLVAGSGSVARSARRAVAVATNSASISRIDVAIAPPAYTRQEASAVRDPQRVDALEGSRLTFRVAASADSLRVESAGGARTLARPTSGDFTWVDTISDDGFVALTPFTAKPGTRRIVALTMQRDGAPVVRISAPGKDLIVPDADRTLDVRIDANDDVGLNTLQLHYTKVSGSGERFEFTEGTIPVQVARDQRTHWTARAALALKPLLVEPGDLVVYRARATDARPGRAPIESDAYIAQLAEASGVAGFGFAMDPDEDRYAVSQQMVIQRTERLIAAQRALALDTVKERASQIAVEQRRVRAEFVFMTGGEFEAGVVEGEEGGTELDESAEADAEQDLAAGRMVNKGRQALLTAIRAMSRASLALTEQRLPDALRYEKVALTNLQEAFARQRFLMRALTQHEALDPARRHSGAFDSLAHAPVSIPVADRDAQRDALRAVLASLVAPGATSSEQNTELAMRVLQVSASRPDAQRIAQWLTAAAAKPAVSRAMRDSAATALTRWIGEGQRNEGGALPPALGAIRRARR